MSHAQTIIKAAQAIGTKPEWLDALINFETDGTYNPQAFNPNSSAKGLIQFIDASAQDLGFADSTDLVNTHPDFDSQMINAVVPYFKMKAVQNGIISYMTKQALYMAVFYPAYWNKPVNTPFPAHVQKINPGIKTPQDYIDFVDARIKKEALKVNPTFPAIAMITIAGIAVWAILKSYRR